MSFLLFALLSFSPIAFGANILGVFSVTSISHQIVYRNLMLELNKRGHNITVITPNPVSDPNLTDYRQIDVSFYYDHWNRVVVANPKELRLSFYIPELFIISFVSVSMDMCHAYLSSPQIQLLINERPKYDLLITEFGLNPCFYGFAKYSGFKHMGIVSFQTSSIVHSNIGNPTDASYLPEVNFPYVGKMSFFQRVRTVIFQTFMWAVYGWIMSVHTDIARQYFGSDLPHLIEIERNLSVMMENSHFTMGHPRPNVPNMIEIGGPAFHLMKKKPKPLPKELKDFLDDAPNGVIYFSLGTNVKTDNISMNVEDILAESFRKVKQKVLWKWENPNLKVKSENVKVGKWFPQVDVLAHPNVKVFVTQAGLQSIGEAIEYNVPMVTLPFFADQSHNARKMELEGVAVNLDFDALSVEMFTQALNDVIYDKKYRENIVRFSALVRDQPIPPLDKAVWWTEYVIRHNGAPHLRSTAATMPWYQYLMLDVLAVIFLVVFLILYIVCFTLRLVIRWSVKAKRD